MAKTTEKRVAPPGPSELLCRECGTVELIRADWQRCWSCYMRCETRNYHTYPTFCAACCGKLH